MSEQAELLKARTRRFALDIIKLIKLLSAEWLDVIAEAQLVTFSGLPTLRQESRELLAIFSASVGTARRQERSR